MLRFPQMVEISAMVPSCRLLEFQESRMMNVGKEVVPIFCRSLARICWCDRKTSHNRCLGVFACDSTEHTKFGPSKTWMPAVQSPNSYFVVLIWNQTVIVGHLSYLL